MRLRRTLLALVSLAVGLAACLASSRPAAAGLYDPIWVNPANAQRAAIVKALAEPTKVEFNQSPLTGAIEDFKNTHHIEIQIDNKALEEAGVALDSPVTFELKGATLRQALNSILRPLELTWVIRSDVLLITTQPEAETLIEWVIYPVEDLLVPPAELRLPGRKYGPDYDSLIDLITSTIAPTTWPEVGGPGPLHPFHGAIMVPQTQQVHDQITELLAELRSVRDAQFPAATDQPAAPVETAVQPPSAAAYAALRKPIHLKLVDASLQDLAKEIASQIQIPVMADGSAFEDAGIHADKIRFTRWLQNIRLHDALDQLLKGRKLGWAVQDGVLLITSEDASKALFETRVYPIRSLGGRTAVTPHRRLKQEYETLHEQISGVVAPASWAEVGGGGAVKVLTNAGALVVSQTTRVHLEIEHYLEALRKLRTEHPGDLSDHEPAENELVIFAYRIPSFFGAEKLADASPLTARQQIAQQYAAALPKLVEPESWGSGRGSIEVVGDMLFIRQRMAVHEQVAEYLPPGSWGMGGMSGISGLR